jgi:uncharacterized membrane protein (Fun14 family)
LHNDDNNQTEELHIKYNGIESFGPTAATLGGGFFLGLLIGYAIKKVIKIAAVIVGLFLP